MGGSVRSGFVGRTWRPFSVTSKAYLTAPIDDYLLVIALFGFVVGCFLPIQKGSHSEFIAQRIIMLVILFPFGEEISETFECLPEITAGMALVLTLLDPLYGIVILFGFHLVIATGANSTAIPVVLDALFLVTLLLHRASRFQLHWLTGKFFPNKTNGGLNSLGGATVFASRSPWSE